jgi:RNA polymerase sigma factor for flagellar operon FliA
VPHQFATQDTPAPTLAPSPARRDERAKHQARPCTSKRPLSSADREALTQQYLPLVRIIATQMRSSFPDHVELDDLIGAGAFGLLDAIDRFSPEKGFQFSTYAQFRIRGAILDSLRALDPGTRGLRRKARELDSASAALSANLGRTPTEQELADRLEITLPQLHTLRRDLNDLEPLDPHAHEEESEQWSERLPAREEDQPLAIFLQAESRNRIQLAMETLPTRHRRVIELYYYEDATMREIGQTLGVVESRVSQMRSLAIASLRRHFTEAPACL